MGSIRVTFYRAKEIRLDKERTQSIYASKSKDVVPERYLKGQDIKTNVKYDFNRLGIQLVTNTTRLIPSRPISPPNLAPKRYEYVPVKGSNGQKYEFVFFYRTRSKLVSRWQNRLLTLSQRHSSISVSSSAAHLPLPTLSSELDALKRELQDSK